MVFSRLKMNIAPILYPIKRPADAEFEYTSPTHQFVFDKNTLTSNDYIVEEVLKAVDTPTYTKTDYFHLPFGIFVISQRHLVVFMCFLGLFMAYIIRICLSQAMIPMSIYYGWDEAIQGHLFAAFYYGYLITQIPGGWVSQVFGSKYVIFAGILGSSLLNAFVPLASANIRWFIALRMLTGFVQGVFYPSCLHLLSCWVEPKNRSIAVAFVISGQHLGTAIAQGGYPLLATRLGWRVPFYLIGIIGFIWSLFWLYFVKSKPSLPVPSVSSSMLICTTPVVDDYTFNGSVSDLQEVSPIPIISAIRSTDSVIHWLSSGTSSFIISKPPWYDLFFHWAVWAYFVLFFCYNWSFYLLVSYLPKYLATILGFSVGSSGKISVAAYIGLYACILIGGRLSSHVISRKLLSPTRTRKLGVLFGLLPSIILLPGIGAGVFRDKHNIAMVLVFSIATTGFAQASYAPNPMDLFPKSPAMVASIGNSIGTLPGFLSSIIAGWILQQGRCTSSSAKTWSKSVVLSMNETLHSPCLTAWGLVFGSCAAVYLFGLVIWLLFASGVPIRSPVSFRTSSFHHKTTPRNTAFDIGDRL